ncbi:growth hormone-inducible transmembrane protein [Platysternon megacephalum]|uniref:Growth hormone-inducible transmembrane protein n=1 Tax=Platysternon megacephalum TaxID=55544 RepID=A0A4D9EH67_9SAUR|nr:growth hormone-inducible transmembrane protein [Platysternon megacephalum]
MRGQLVRNISTLYTFVLTSSYSAPPPLPPQKSVKMGKQKHPERIRPTNRTLESGFPLWTAQLLVGRLTPNEVNEGGKKVEPRFQMSECNLEEIPLPPPRDQN